MAETLHHQEHHEKHHFEPEQHAEHAQVKAETHPAQETLESRHRRLAESRQHIQEEAKASSGQLDKLEMAEANSTVSTPQYINQELKQITLRRELQHIRRKLPVPDRVLSRVIHQPAVRIASEAIGKSVSRPSGLLGGGLMAFIGSAGYLYLAKHIGFNYNYGMFLILFVGGFILGVVLELSVYLATASRRRVDS